MEITYTYESCAHFDHDNCRMQHLRSLISQEKRRPHFRPRISFSSSHFLHWESSENKMNKVSIPMREFTNVNKNIQERHEFITALFKYKLFCCVYVFHSYRAILKIQLVFIVGYKCLYFFNSFQTLLLKKYKYTKLNGFWFKIATPLSSETIHVVEGHQAEFDKNLFENLFYYRKTNLGENLSISCGL